MIGSIPKGSSVLHSSYVQQAAFVLHRTYAVEGNFEQEPYGPQLGKSYSTA
jgi:hypothetical protein